MDKKKKKITLLTEAVDDSAINDMSIDDLINTVVKFRLDELKGEDRRDAITAFLKVVEKICTNDDHEKANDFIARFVDKFSEIRMEMQTGEGLGNNKDDKGQTKRLNEPYVKSDPSSSKYGSNSDFSALIGAANGGL